MEIKKRIENCIENRISKLKNDREDIKAEFENYYKNDDSIYNKLEKFNDLQKELIKVDAKIDVLTQILIDVDSIE